MELSQEIKNITEVIKENVKIKGEIVEKDELDKGERQLLNFGHTIGHAVEQLSKYEIPHGNAVAVGMSYITRAAVRKGLCPPECLDILEKLLRAFSLPMKCEFSPREIYEAALSDKKRDADTLTEVIPLKIGECVLQQMPVSDLLSWIEIGASVRERDLT